jgi:hypothetical protein
VKIPGRRELTVLRIFLGCLRGNTSYTRPKTEIDRACLGSSQTQPLELTYVFALHYIYFERGKILRWKIWDLRKRVGEVTWFCHVS